MKIGLAGLAGSGKTTIFSALTGVNAETGPGGRVKTNLGSVHVPDPRLTVLSELCKPEKTTPTELAFADVAGSGKPHAGYFDPTRTAAMRDTDVLAQIVRAFPDAMGNSPDPAGEIQSFATEMNLQDMILVERRLERLKKERGSPREIELLQRLHKALEEDKPVRLAGLSTAEMEIFQGFRFLSEKPLIIVLNVTEDDVAADISTDIKGLCEQLKTMPVSLSGKIEKEIVELPPEERAEFLGSLGLEAPASHRFVRAAFEAADLIVFFTIGEDECRAWPIERGTTAQPAAGKIHSDLEKGFIRAEVIKYDDFARLKSEARCREGGKQRTEGRDYVVQDGDILHIRFSR